MKTMKNISNKFKHSKIMETKSNNTKGWTAKEENKKQVNPGVPKVHNLIIVDESGSMSSIYNAALTGMNETLNTIRQLASDNEAQKQDVTLVTFDTSHYNKIFDSVPAKKTRILTQRDYRPGGCTPLYDAMGKALTELEPNVKENEAVLVTVITDGYENASCEYSLRDIRALVDRLDTQGWVFTYIGANQDSAAVGESMGISDTLDFEANEDSMAEMREKERNSRVHFNEYMRQPAAAPQKYERGKFFKN